LLTLHGVLIRKITPDHALWIRQRALREKKSSKRGRFHWLTPPSFEGGLTVSDIAQAPTPVARADKAREYVEQGGCCGLKNTLKLLRDGMMPL